jgi:hypothetical protein
MLMPPSAVPQEKIEFEPSRFKSGLFGRKSPADFPECNLSSFCLRGLQDIEPITVV